MPQPGGKAQHDDDADADRISKVFDGFTGTTSRKTSQIPPRFKSHAVLRLCFSRLQFYNFTSSA